MLRSDIDRAAYDNGVGHSGTKGGAVVVYAHDGEGNVGRFEGGGIGWETAGWLSDT